MKFGHPTTTKILAATGCAMALLMLVFALPSAGQTPGGRSAGTIVTSSGVYEIPSATVEVNELGGLPSTITVTVGAQVTWVNATDQTIQLSDQPVTTDQQPKMYLPFVTAGGARSATSADPVGATWVSDSIAPGGQYSRVFGEAGVFPYYASHVNGVVGTVTVLADTLVSTELVDATQGGTVTAGDSTLVIPPGALAKDTTITVGRSISGTTMQTEGMVAVSLEADDLQLLAPLTLTLHYNEPGPSYDESFMQVVAYNEQTGEWTPEQVVAFDPAANTLSVEVEHFSWRLAVVDQPLYTVLEIPGKYLDPGDILYTLADGNHTWFPGHTGIYSDTIGATLAENGEARIMESNAWDRPDSVDCGILSGLFRRSGGVRAWTLGQFISDPNHLFMGAHRNPKATVDDKRNARDFAVSQANAGFILVGQGNTGNGCFSCVGLAESSYDHADDLTANNINIIPDWQEVPLISPLQQFRATTPVDSVSVMVGELVRISVYAVVLNETTKKYDKGGTVLAVDLPTGSTFVSGLFSWTPQAADDGNTYTVQFQAEATVGGKQRNVSQSLTIHVAAAESTPTPTPPPNVDTAEEILIPAGSFQMGCDSSNPAEYCLASEQPLHSVSLSAYYIDKYEVTNGSYKACEDAGGCTAPKSVRSLTRNPYYGTTTYADYPVINVNWNQATAFCTWIGKRLPSEAEWERAARGSSDMRKYPWGNSAPDCTKLNYYHYNGSNYQYCVNDTSRVGSYPSGASPDDVMDMAGNVYEWLNDWYQYNYYSVSPGSNPPGSATGTSRVLRGGSWGADYSSVRVALRDNGIPDYWNLMIGFRCARSR